MVENRQFYLQMACPDGAYDAISLNHRGRFSSINFAKISLRDKRSATETAGADGKNLLEKN